MTRRVLGLAMASGNINFGLVERDGDQTPRMVEGGPARLTPSSNLDQAEQLSDLAARFTQVLREVRPDEVVIVGTRKFAQWKYREAYDRVALIVTTMLQCSAQGIPVAEMKTEAISKVVQVPADHLERLDHTLAGFDARPTYWTTGRAEAFAAAYARASD